MASSFPSPFAVGRPAFCEPCYCDRCRGAEKLRGDLCDFCGEPQWGCRNIPCSCEVSRHEARLCVCGMDAGFGSSGLCGDCWLSDYRRRYRGASDLQRLWRGYKARKSLAERNAEEVRAHTPIWRFYDDQYRMYAFCQTLMGELKKDDPSWDATQEPYYIWMLEHGPMLEEWETFLRRRGWVRPKKKGLLNVTVFKRLIKGVLDSCGVPQGSQKVTLALYDTFVATR